MPKDSAAALKLYHASALQGNVYGQCGLGELYANGEGVPKDEVEGLAWANIAAASGNAYAVDMRNMMEHRVGRQMTLVAQQRSHAIEAEIRAAHAQPSPLP